MEEARETGKEKEKRKQKKKNKKKSGGKGGREKREKKSWIGAWRREKGRRDTGELKTGTKKKRIAKSYPWLSKKGGRQKPPPFDVLVLSVYAGKSSNR